MANMSYCRFQNTLLDLKDCLWHLQDNDLSQEEQDARTVLIQICKNIVQEDKDMKMEKKTDLNDIINIVNEYRTDNGSEKLNINAATFQDSNPADLKRFLRDFTDLANGGREPEIFGLKQEEYHGYVINFKMAITTAEAKESIQKEVADRMQEKPVITKGLRPR